MTLQEHLLTLRRQWKVVIAGLVVGLIAASIVALLTTRQYAASTTLYIVAQGTDTAALAYQGGLLSEQRVTSYKELFIGRRVAEATSTSLQGTLTPADIQQRLNATSETDSVLITATATDPDPAVAKSIADSASTAFVELIGELEQVPGGNRPPAVVARVVEPASLPIAPVSPDIPLYISVGTLIGLLLGTLASYWREQSDTSVRTVEASAEAASTVALGGVPEAVGNFDTVPLILDRLQSAFSESFRKIRTNLQFVAIDEKSSKALAFTSSAAGEGKTTTTLNTALALAEAGYRVVVVDADLRRPSIASALGLEEAVGLSTVLAGRATVGNSLQSSRHRNLSVLTSGRIPPNPSELLGSQSMSRAIGDLKCFAEYVLIDTAPALPVTDAVALSVHCDGVVVVCRYGETTVHQIASVAEVVRTVSGRVIGSVLTMVPQASSRTDPYYTAYAAASQPPVE